jgi:antibiotic biosynthesis monooxygenase (ABM) superfamily enzyme
MEGLIRLLMARISVELLNYQAMPSIATIQYAPWLDPPQTV